MGKEYAFIREIGESGRALVFPLWFERGGHVTPTTSFPKGFLQQPFQPVLDCCRPETYLSALPFMIGRMHGFLQQDGSPKSDMPGAAQFYGETQSYLEQLRAISAATTVSF